jgi:hypothetical protein
VWRQRRISSKEGEDSKQNARGPVCDGVQVFRKKEFGV